mgnify:CR=1 FL=1
MAIINYRINKKINIDTVNHYTDRLKIFSSEQADLKIERVQRTVICRQNGEVLAQVILDTGNTLVIRIGHNLQNDFLLAHSLQSHIVV